MLASFAKKMKTDTTTDPTEIPMEKYTLNNCKNLREMNTFLDLFNIPGFKKIQKLKINPQ